MLVRRAEPHDAARVATLLDAFNREYDSPAPELVALTERLTALLASDTFALLIAGSPPSGYASVSLRPSAYDDGPVALLEDLYVRPELRGQGIGARLIAAVVAHCREVGAGLLEVNVDEADADALRFYAREGFALLQPDTGERAFYLSRDVTSAGDDASG